MTPKTSSTINTTTINTVIKTKLKESTKAKNTLVCFSFAAYSRALIDHLKSLRIPILTGLTDQEFTLIESCFNFIFPPDLRSILQRGLPVGPHFPNWRFSSRQQLQVLLHLPLFNLIKKIRQNNFWVVESWGYRPEDEEKAVSVAMQFMNKAPVLVPIYHNCYIPASAENVAGNPVFYVDDKEVRVLSFDIARFFKEAKFFYSYDGGGCFTGPALDLPVWAAKQARRVEFWTDVAERGRRVVARGGTWWHRTAGCKLVGCLEDSYWRLRDGGWSEEEVSEMLLIDGFERNGGVHVEKDVVWHVTMSVFSLSLVLLRAGWSMDEVVYSFNL